jgi:hypothetical protein
MKRIVLLPGNDPVKAAELKDILLRAGIEVSHTRQGFRSASAHDYLGSETVTAREFPAGSYIIDLAQPQKRLAKALLEPETKQDAAFVREQLARFARNERRGRSAAKEEYGFYDITAWSLPLAFGVEAYWTEDASPVESVPEQPEREPQSGEASSSSERSWHYGVSGRASVAYIIPYDRDGAASLVYRLQSEGFRVAVATRTLSAGGSDWPRGTMVVRVSRNPDTLHEAIMRLSRDTRVAVTAVNTGFTETGETPVGSENVISLRQPRIIVAADEPVDQTSYGAIWWLFDRSRIDFTPMTIGAIKRAQLDRYNVIILPDGDAADYYSEFGKSGVETLRGWCERGGTLVCIKGAAVFATLKDVNLTSSRLVGSDEDDQKTEDTEKPSPSASPQARQVGAPAPGKGRRTTQDATEQQRTEADQTEKLEGAPPDLPPIASPSSRPGRVPEAVPGAIMRATVDRSTYLTFGYEDAQLPVLVASGYFFRPSKEGTNAIVFTGDVSRPLHISGFVWPDNTERLLRGTAYVLDEPTGRGHVILYAEDPNYRGFWRITTRLFFNSILFPTGM